jgi:hypothetical protein
MDTIMSCELRIQPVLLNFYTLLLFIHEYIFRYALFPSLTVFREKKELKLIVRYCSLEENIEGKM